jgi:hypothetical protein
VLHSDSERVLEYIRFACTHCMQVQPAICSERICAVRIDQIGLLAKISHHAVWLNDLLLAKAGEG